MGWFGSASEERDLYRRALARTLVQFASASSGRPSVMMKGLASRLEAGQSVDNLEQELAAIFKDQQARQSPNASDGPDLPQMFGLLLGKVSTTLRLSSLLDEELEDASTLLINALPPRVGPADIAAIDRVEAKLRRVAVRARGRALASRAEVAALISELSDHLPLALRAASNMQRGLASLEGEVAQVEEAEMLGEFRSQLMKGLSGLSADASAIESEMRSAQDELAKLKDVLDPAKESDKDAVTGLLSLHGLKRKLAV